MAQDENATNLKITPIVADFEENLKSTLKALQDNPALQDNRKDTLHHYTTSEGLLGIVSGPGIRATDVRFLNDSSELDYGFRLVQRVVKSLEETVPKDTYDQLRIATRVATFIGSSPMFVFCLSEEGNQLSQWRAYSGSDGCSIEFDSVQLQSTLWARNPAATLKLYRITYDSPRQEELISRMSALFCEYLPKADAYEQTFLQTLLAHCFFDLCAGFKDPSFWAEEEWRLVVRFPSKEAESDFRIMRGRLVPYILLTPRSENAPLPILSVTSGPSPHPELHNDAVSRLLKRHRYYDVNVHDSEIPLRH